MRGMESCHPSYENEVSLNLQSTMSKFDSEHTDRVVSHSDLYIHYDSELNRQPRLLEIREVTILEYGGG